MLRVWPAGETAAGPNVLASASAWTQPQRGRVTIEKMVYPRHEKYHK